MGDSHIKIGKYKILFIKRKYYPHQDIREKQKLETSTTAY